MRVVAILPCRIMLTLSLEAKVLIILYPGCIVRMYGNIWFMG